MSEYQCFQFDTIDRCLTATERKKVSELSSHISVGSSSAIVEYNYSDFKHDPVEVLKHYFDLFTFEANWGEQRLVFRFNKELVDAEALSQYAIEDAIEIIEGKKTIIVDCHLDENWNGELIDRYDYDNGYEHACNVGCSPFISFYNEIIEGDYRSLYMFWLRVLELRVVEFEDDNPAAPIPAGLAQIDDAHNAWMQFIDLNNELLEAAQNRSTPISKKPDNSFTPEKHLHLLSDKEGKTHLKNFLTQTPHEAKTTLISNLRKAANIDKPQKPKKKIKLVSYEELACEVAETKAELARIVEEEVRKKQKLYLAKLQERSTEIWAKVTAFIKRKKIKDYEKAVFALRALKYLATEDGTLGTYYQKTEAIAHSYPHLPGLQWRLKEAELIRPPDNSEEPSIKLRPKSWQRNKPTEPEFDFSILNQ